MKVVELPTRKTETQDQIIDELEELLDRARQGEFTGFAWCAARADGGVATSWVQSEDWHQLLSGVVTLQWRMVEQRQTLEE